MSTVRIELFFSTVAEAAAFLAGRDTSALVTEPVATEGKETKARKTKPAETAGSTTSSADSSASSTKETKPETPPSEPEVKQEPVAEVKATPAFEYPVLQKAVMDLVAAGGQKQIAEILAELGLPTFKGSDPTVWPAAKEKLDAALAQLKAGGDLA